MRRLGALLLLSLPVLAGCDIRVEAEVHADDTVTLDATAWTHLPTYEIDPLGEKHPLDPESVDPCRQFRQLSCVSLDTTTLTDPADRYHKGCRAVGTVPSPALTGGRALTLMHADAIS